jgi:hypothetical protein
MADDGGVLGNLPRSRPGARSEKRTEKTAAKAATRAERSGSKAAAPASGAKSQSRSQPKRKSTAPPQPDPHAGDPLGGAIRTVTGVAATGARVAGGVAREVLRRLPRP